MYCCSAQDSKMDYKRRFMLGGSKQKVQQHQQYQIPELGRALGGPLGSSCSGPAPVGSCGHPPPSAGSGSSTSGSAVADIQQGISKYLDALNVFCRASTFLTELFSGVFRSSHYAKAAMQLKDVQEHVMEAASRLTAAIKPEIAKMLMELSAGAASFKDQDDFNLQDVEVLGRCFLTVMQVHFQFLSQALQKVQPVAQSCLAEALAKAQERRAGGGGHPQGSETAPLSELEEASRSWKGAAEATARLRERGCDGCLAGLQVQQLFCSHSPTILEHQLKELNLKIDAALQAYKTALDSLGHSEYALKAGFHLNPKAAEAALQGCCSEAEAQQAGRMQSPSQPIQCELPTIPLQIGPHFLKGISFNESAADNLKLKTHAMLQLLKEAAGPAVEMLCDGDSLVTEILNQVCPSSWRGACKTAVQLLFGQAGLVVVDTAQIDNREAYAPHIIMEGGRIVIQVPSTWCLKEDPATMSLLQRSLDPEKTLGLVDVLYTAIFDLNRWKERRDQALPIIQMQLQRETSDLPSGSGSKSSSGLPKTISKLTSKFTKKASSSGSNSSSYSVSGTPSRCLFPTSSSEDKSKASGPSDSRLPGVIHVGSLPGTPDPSLLQLANGAPFDDKGTNLPTDQEMQDVIDFLSGFNMGRSQQTSPLVKRRNSVASTGTAELKPPAGVPSGVQTHSGLQPSPLALQQQQQGLSGQQQNHPGQQQGLSVQQQNHPGQQQGLSGQQQTHQGQQQGLSGQQQTHLGQQQGLAGQQQGLSGQQHTHPNQQQIHPGQQQTHQGQQQSQQQGLQNQQQSHAAQQQSHAVQQQTHPGQQQGLPGQQQTHPSQQQSSQPTLQYYQNLLQPIGQHQQPPPPSLQQQRGPSKWLGSPSQHAPPGPPAGLSPIGSMGQWGSPALPDLSSNLYSLGLVGNYMDSVMSEMLGQKPHGPRNNTWPNREQTEGTFGMLGDVLPFDPAVGSDPEFARYVAGVNHAMQQKRQAQHVRRPSNARANWPITDEPHRSWPHPEYFTERDTMSGSWSTNQGDSASSSDETSSANGDSLFSMFSGPDLVAAVKQRRKHSCGESEVCTLPSPPAHHPGDSSSQDSKTKTWPPKAPWQHSSPHTNTLPNPGSSLYQLSIPSSQWNDSMRMLQSPVWSTAGDCPATVSLSPGFPFAQQQQQQPQPPQPQQQGSAVQQQVSQHKSISKGFKSFPLKHEHRSSYLPQY